MEYLKILSDRPVSPYYDVTVLPHLDHAHPESDRWALVNGLDYLASVMFDAQSFCREKNIGLTRDYVESYGSRVMVEGIMDQLKVQGESKTGGNVTSDSRYAESACEYVRATGVDFLVADLGTEQQSSGNGQTNYLRERAHILSTELDGCGLVLHGTSSLEKRQMQGLGEDGVERVNMWTRIARESGRYAADRLTQRMELIRNGDFEASDSKQYMYDSVERAALIMEEVLHTIGYFKLEE